MEECATPHLALLAGLLTDICGGNLFTDKKQLCHQWSLDQYSKQYLLSIKYIYGNQNI